MNIKFSILLHNLHLNVNLGMYLSGLTYLSINRYKFEDWHLYFQFKVILVTLHDFGPLVTNTSKKLFQKTYFLANIITALLT